jgi:hypothetical protein
MGNSALAPTHKFPISTLPNYKHAKRGHTFSGASYQGGEGYFNLSDASAPAPAPNSMPVSADQTILIYTKMEVLARLGNVPSGFINRTTWAPQTSPAKPLIEMERGMWDQNQLVPGVEVGRWVDIVVNNLDDRGHPFHLVRDDYLTFSHTPASFFPHRPLIFIFLLQNI